ncbi:MAG: hypothetical protein LUD12_11135 [Lachnospiraceae bacterium]|nr:hypothetical protein [Lachnospiraceae bacterium]
MKLKRTKLAALALTALMAVGATSLVAYAGETDEPNITAENDADDYTLYVKNIQVVSYDISAGTAVVSYDMVDASNNRVSTEYPSDAKLTVTKAATCEGTGTYKITATINGTEKDVTSYSADAGVIAALGHDWELVKTVETQKVTCTQDGFQKQYYVCNICQNELEKEVVTPAYGHNWVSYGIYAKSGDNIVIDTSTSITVNYLDGVALTTPLTLYKAKLDDDGNVQLISKINDGTYYTVSQCSHNACSEFNAVEKTKEAVSSSYIVIVDCDGIASTDAVYIEANAATTSKTHYSTTLTDLPETDDIELKDCSVAGSYTVEFFDESGNSKGTKVIEVPAHHMITKVIVYASSTDAEMCNLVMKNGKVVVDDDGYPVITNTSCYLNAYYYEVELCSAAGCTKDKFTSASLTVGAEDYSSSITYHVVNTSDKLTAAPEGEHVALADAKEKIATAATAYGSKFTYEVLEGVIAGTTPYDGVNGTLYGGSTTASDGTVYKWSTYVKLSDDTSTCTTDGTATITYICIVDNKNTAETQTITVKAKGHDIQTVVEDYTAASCEADGGFNSVVRCVRDGCDYVVSSTSYTIQRLAHTNEKTASDGIHPASGDANDYTDTRNQKIYLEITGSKVVDVKGYLTTDSTITYVDESSTDAVTGNGGWVRIGVDSDDTLAVYARAYTLCTTCTGTQHKVYITPASASYATGTNSSTTGYIKVTVDAINKQDSDGAGGFVTLTATYVLNSNVTKTVVPYTTTVAYYTSESAYTARLASNTTDTDPDEDVKNGLVKDSDGVWRYYQSGTWANTTTGVYGYDGSLFFVTNGVLDTSANELCLYNGVWYYVANGQVQLSYNGLAQHDGAWFYVTSGILDTTKNGLVTYDGAQFLVAAGQVLTSYNGLWQYSSTIGGDDNWYFIAAGQVVDYSGVVMYDNAFFVVVDGVLDTSYNGTVEYDGATFNVIAGQLYDQVA